MGQQRYRFLKKEKLTGKKNIEGLFKRGSSFYLGDFLVKEMASRETISYNKILISVPKKNFKRAVDRNLLKRRIREAYRLNKRLIQSKERSSFRYIGFVYLSKHILTFHDIQDQLIKCLKRLQSKMQ